LLILVLYKVQAAGRRLNVSRLSCWSMLSVILLFFVIKASGINQYAIYPDSSGTQPLHSKIIIQKIGISGNSKTKPNIIRRELMYTEGDTLSWDDFKHATAQSKINLLNTLLFNFVTIDTLLSLGKYSYATVSISVTEQWYIWPTPIIEINDRNFNAWWSKHDFSRINYGVKIYYENFRGRLENLNILLRLGVTQRFLFLYNIPYIDRKKQFGIGLGFDYDHNKEVGFGTSDDHLQILSDPNYLLKTLTGTLQLRYRPAIHYIHELNIGYIFQSFADTLLKLNPSFSNSKETSLRYPQINYRLRCDYRDDKNYPLDGWYSELNYFHYGWGNFNGNFTNIDWIKLSLRKYTPLSKCFFTGVSADGKISSKAWQPYILQSGFGYGRDYVRGYEYYVVDGQQYFLLKSNLMFALLPQKTFMLPYVNSEKFTKGHIALYLTAFFDGGYVWDRQWKGEFNNNLPNSFLFGTGMGLDIVTYYDKVFRLEYSVNKKGEAGLFIHFMSTI
jgi:outer membrane protein assembly factor BamA